MTMSGSSGSPTVVLNLPGDEETLAAAGAVVLSHEQLELTLRMTIKTLSGLNVKEALNATDDLKNWQLRNEVKRLFKNHTRDPLLALA